VLAVLATVVLLRAWVVDTVSVASDSMAPTLCAGDWLLVSKVRVGNGVSAGDVVVFRAPGEDEQSVKRVVAVEGQAVEIRDAVLYVDGLRRPERYVDERTVDGTFFGPVVVADDSVFVMGDRREFSIDSRDYGSVRRDRIEGLVVARVGGECPPSSPPKP
jgi:signal peptidase I